MTYAEFEDMATNLNMPTVSEYNNITNAKIKLDVTKLIYNVVIITKKRFHLKVLQRKRC